MAAKPSNELMTTTMDAGEDADFTTAMKKLAIEEGDGGNSDSSSDDSIVSDMGSDSEWLACRYFPEREPEWDVDSFDGQELNIHPLVRKTYPTQELYDQYYEKRLKAFESKILREQSTKFTWRGRMRNHNTARDFMADLANVCVKKFNETKGKTLELVNVLRATESGGSKWKMYITFMAREYHEGLLLSTKLR